MVREATDQDSSSIVDLIFDIWTNEYQFEVQRENFPDLQEIEKYYTKAGGSFFVAIVNHEIIGTIACDKLEQNHFVLKRMFVKKNYRGLGVAQSLLNELLNQAVFLNNPTPLFFLSTKESEAVAAKQFYLKNGFQIIPKSALPKNFPFFYKDDLFMLRDKY